MNQPDGIDSKGNIVSLQPVKLDADVARELREEVMPHLLAACAVVEKAKASGLVLNFAFGPDMFGRMSPQNVVVSKPL